MSRKPRKCPKTCFSARIESYAFVCSLQRQEAVKSYGDGSLSHIGMTTFLLLFSEFVCSGISSARLVNHHCLILSHRMIVSNRGQWPHWRSLCSRCTISVAVGLDVFCMLRFLSVRLSCQRELLEAVLFSALGRGERCRDLAVCSSLNLYISMAQCSVDRHIWIALHRN